MPKPTNEDKQLYFSIWEKAISTQQHFNDMCVKSRQFGLAFVAAALGLGAALFIQGDDFSISLPWEGWKLHAIVLIVLSGAFAMYAVSLLDLNVYHKMLRGAVVFNEDFERKYMKEIFDLEKGMTEAISHFSRFSDAKFEKDAETCYQGSKKVNAAEKIRNFYNISIFILIATATGLFCATCGHTDQALTVAFPALLVGAVILYRFK